MKADVATAEITTGCVSTFTKVDPQSRLEVFDKTGTLNPPFLMSKYNSAFHESPGCFCFVWLGFFLTSK